MPSRNSASEGVTRPVSCSSADCTFVFVTLPTGSTVIWLAGRRVRLWFLDRHCSQPRFVRLTGRGHKPRAQETAVGICVSSSCWRRTSLPETFDGRAEASVR